MPKKISILFLIILFGGLFFPALTLAGDYDVDGKNVHYEGLVPCGKAKVSSGETDEVTQRCQFCHLFVMLAGIITFVLFDILPPVAVLMMVIAGVMFFFGGGNPSLLLQAKKLITSIVIGLVIIFSAYLIVGAVLTATGVLGWTTLDKWLDNGTFTVNCPIGEGGAGGNGGNGNGGDGYDVAEIEKKKKEIEEKYPNLVGEWKEMPIGCPDWDQDCDEAIGTAECGTQKKIKDGFCFPTEPTKLLNPPGEIMGNGWYCELGKADANSPSPEGKSFAYCVPE